MRLPTATLSCGLKSLDPPNDSSMFCVCVCELIVAYDSDEKLLLEEKIWFGLRRFDKLIE